jgi:DNA-binding NtrC family response regulator
VHGITAYGDEDRAAKRLGITRNTLYYKVCKHRIALRKGASADASDGDSHA